MPPSLLRPGRSCLSYQCPPVGFSDLTRGSVLSCANEEWPVEPSFSASAQRNEDRPAKRRSPIQTKLCNRRHFWWFLYVVRTNGSKQGAFMTSILGKVRQITVGVIAVSALTWGISGLYGAGFEENRKTPDVSPQQTATPTPGVPVPQIDGNGTITAPNGGRPAQFFIFDVEN